MYLAWMEGTKKPREKFTRIQRYFSLNPNWTRISKEQSLHLYIFKDMLLESAMEFGGDTDFEILLDWGTLPTSNCVPRLFKMEEAYFAQRGDILLSYIEKIGREETLARPDLYGKLISYVSKDSMTKLLGKWLRETSTQEETAKILSTLRHLPGSRDRLLSLLLDLRPYAIKESFLELSILFPDETSLTAFKKTYQRRVDAQAKEEELLFYRNVIVDLDRELAEQQLLICKQEDEIKRLIIKLSEVPFAQEYLVRWLKDSRPFVVREAAYWLTHSPNSKPSESELQQVREAAQFRKEAGASEDELKCFQETIRWIENRIAQKNKKEPRP